MYTCCPRNISANPSLLSMIWLVNWALDLLLFLIRRLTKLLLQQVLQYTLTLHTIHLHHTGLNEKMENMTFCSSTNDDVTLNGDKPTEKKILSSDEAIVRAMTGANKVIVFTNAHLSNTTFN